MPLTCEEVRECLKDLKYRLPKGDPSNPRYEEALEIAESYINYVELGFKLAKSNGEN